MATLSGPLCKVVTLALLTSRIFAYPFDGGRSQLSTRQDDDASNDDDIDNPYADFKVVASIGDSFAAGIGVNEPYQSEDAEKCRRFDGGYPVKMNQIIGAEHFEFVACSGATTDGVYDQVRALSRDQYDLMTVSAGGNDVGFSDALKNCVLMGTTQEDCDEALAQSEKNIDEDLGDKIERLLAAVDTKVHERGAIVWSLYPRFFDAEETACDDQIWCVWWLSGSGCLSVKQEMRQKFNDLVDKANKVIRDTINNYQQSFGSGQFTYDLQQPVNQPPSKAYAVEWSMDVEMLGARFCEAGSALEFGDASNEDIGFFRPTAWPTGTNLDEIKKARDDPVNGTALEERSWFELEVPVWAAKLFHPTEMGTIVQASRALAYVRAHLDYMNGDLEKLDSCEYVPGSSSDDDSNDSDESDEDESDEDDSDEEPEPVDSLSCADPGVSGAAYIARDNMASYVEQFCADEVDGVDKPDLTIEYKVDTFDGAELSITSDSKLSETECLDSMMRIVDACVPAENNPMNWKYGGQLSVNDASYNIRMKGPSTNRLMNGTAPMQRPIASWSNDLGSSHDRFAVWGGGWANADYAEDLKSAIDECSKGSSSTGLKAWGFEYYDEPDVDGYEWQAFGITARGYTKESSGGADCVRPQIPLEKYKEYEMVKKWDWKSKYAMEYEEL